MGFFDFLAELFGVDRATAGLRMHSRKDCALRLLQDVSHPDQYFKLENGIELRGLCDLADALEFIDEETFGYHVNEYKNDFGDWVRYVIGDRVLADKLDEMYTQDQFARAVSTRVNYFKSLVR